MTAAPHGTTEGYDEGCRCQQCRNANHARNRAIRVARLGIDAHGTTAAYRTGCRCQPCRDANTQAHRQYVDQNRERINARSRMRRLEDPEHARAVEKAWRDANIEHVRERARQRHRDWTNSVTRSRRRAALWDAAKRTLIAYLGGRCVDCGNTDPRVLHFDHLDVATKTSGVPDLVRRRGLNHPDVWAEVDKCALRCANCHAIKTFEEGDYFNGKARQHSDPPDFVQDVLEPLSDDFEPA